MKKQEVNNIEVLNAVVNQVVKSGKQRKAENSTTLQAVGKAETRARFMAYITSSEQMGLNKFFKLFNAFKASDPEGYAEYLAARKMDVSIDYTFEWFKCNCPSLDGTFAKWVKVTDKNPANEDNQYNRRTAAGVQYTLIAYNCFRANWEQYERILNDVVREVKRLQNERTAIATAQRKEAAAKEKAEKAALLEKKKAAAKAKELEKLTRRLKELQAA